MRIGTELLGVQVVATGSDASSAVVKVATFGPGVLVAGDQRHTLAKVMPEWSHINNTHHGHFT
jgi:hypothetical protein